MAPYNYMPKKLTNIEFIKKCDIIHNNFYDYSLVDYINSYTKVNIICPIHGIFQQRPSHHLFGQTCFKCSLDKKPVCQKTTQENFIKDSKEIHEDKFDYSKVEYAGSNNKVIIICNIHGEFLQKPASHLRGHGCPICGVELRTKSRILSTEKFVSLAIKKHKNKYDYSEAEYFSNKIPIKIICYTHGAFYQTPNIHLMGSGCTKCTKLISNMETRWLDSLGLPDDPQHRNVKIKRNKKFFKVDGLDPNNNTVYEFYGDFWHGNPEVYIGTDYCEATNKTFGEMFSKTIEKENELKLMGYKLITIWEKDYKKKNDHEKL